MNESSESHVNLSVIVLTQLSEVTWAKLLSDLALLSGQSELIFVGAQSENDLFERTIKRSAVTCPSFWLQSTQSRGSQLNSAVKKSQKEYLWFLNPDCRVSSLTLQALERSIQANPLAIHYFDLHYDTDGPSLAQLNTLGIWLRSHALHLPLGNQGLCLSREVFNQIGGFNEGLRQGEDQAFIFEAKLKQVKICPVNSPLLVSAKKYSQNSWSRLTMDELTEATQKTLPDYLHFLKKRWFKS